MSRQPWRELVPGVFEQFDRIEALAAAAVDPELAGPVRAAVAANLGLPVSEAWTAAPVTERGAAAARFTEQFVIDVAGVDGELRSAIGAACGAATFEFVQCVYVFDVFTRARVALERLFDEPWSVGAAPRSDLASGELWPALEEFMRSVALLESLDPVTTELVRLRGARVHQCRLCQSRLSVDAVDAADDPSIFERVALDGNDEARFVTAVELADVLVTQPAQLDAELVARARAEFDDAQVVEIVLDVVRNAANKIAVAFGADAPNVERGVEYYVIDAAGEVVANVDRAALAR